MCVYFDKAREINANKTVTKFGKKKRKEKKKSRERRWFISRWKCGVIEAQIFHTHKKV